MGNIRTAHIVYEPFQLLLQLLGRRLPRPLSQKKHTINNSKGNQRIRGYLNLGAYIYTMSLNANPSKCQPRLEIPSGGVAVDVSVINWYVFTHFIFRCPINTYIQSTKHKIIALVSLSQNQVSLYLKTLTLAASPSPLFHF